MTRHNDYIKENFIEKVIHFSNIEINALFDTVYIGNDTLSTEIHSHFNYEVHTCLKGEYIIESSEQQCITMKPNQFCIIPSEYYHSSKAIVENTEWRAFRFYLIQNKFKNNSKGCYSTINELLTKNKSPICLYSRELTELIKKIHKELYSEMNGYSIASEILLVHLFSGLFAAIIPETQEILYGASNNDSYNSRAFKIESFFYNNYLCEISEQTLADYLNLSVRQTSRTLKKLYGMSFREKLINLRMTNAVKLLLRTNLSVSMIAEKMGYASTPGFCTSFKKFYGLPPKKYKTKYKENA